MHSTDATRLHLYVNDIPCIASVRGLVTSETILLQFFPFSVECSSPLPDIVLAACSWALSSSMLWNDGTPSRIFFSTNLLLS